MSQPTQFRLNAIFDTLSQIPDQHTLIGYDQPQLHVPKKIDDYFFRREFLREIAAFLNRPRGDGLFITGPTGSGKTSGVAQVAARTNWPVLSIAGHGRFEFSDLIGHHTLASNGTGQAPVMQFQHGPLATAMKEGMILFINEVDMIDPSELVGLNDILSGEPLVIAENGGEIIPAHPMFRLVATGNSRGAGDDGLYQGVQSQNMATMDRFRFIEVDYAPEGAEVELLQSQVPQLPTVLLEGMVKVANEVRRLFDPSNEDEQASSAIGVTMSTRALIRWANLTIDYAGAPGLLGYALDQALTLRCDATERTAIHRIAEDVFGGQWESE